MAQVTCPKCGARAEMAGGRAYCALCGWNRQAAIRRLARIEWASLALILLFDVLGIFGFGVLQKDWPLAILSATLPTLALGMVLAGAAQGLRKLRRTGGRSARADQEPARREAPQARAAGAKPGAGDYDFLLALPPPRPVRLTRRGRVSLGGILILVLVFDSVLVSKLFELWRGTGAFPHFPFAEMALLAFVIVLTGVPFLIRRRMVRDQELMERGALAMGRVTEQKQVKSNFVIAYEFADASGRRISGSANDFTRLLYPGMKVPVFYDSRNSERHIAACASWFEIVNPGIN